MRQFDLLRPNFFETAEHYHFGRDDIALPWAALC